MADDKNNTEEEGDEAPEKKKRSLVAILLAVLVLVSNGALVLVLLGGGSGNAGADQEDEADASAPRTEPGPMLSLDPFVINLDEPGQPRYLRIGIGVEVASEDAVADVDARMTILRDRFISLLSSQQADALRTIDDKDRLREELLELARDVVSSQAILGIYFTEFLIQ